MNLLLHVHPQRAPQDSALDASVSDRKGIVYILKRFHATEVSYSMQF